MLFLVALLLLPQNVFGSAVIGVGGYAMKGTLCKLSRDLVVESLKAMLKKGSVVRFNSYLTLSHTTKSLVPDYNKIAPNVVKKFHKEAIKKKVKLFLLLGCTPYSQSTVHFYYEFVQVIQNYHPVNNTGLRAYNGGGITFSLNYNDPYLKLVQLYGVGFESDSLQYKINAYYAKSNRAQLWKKNNTTWPKKVADILRKRYPLPWKPAARTVTKLIGIGTYEMKGRFCKLVRDAIVVSLKESLNLGAVVKIQSTLSIRATSDSQSRFDKSNPEVRKFYTECSKKNIPLFLLISCVPDKRFGASYGIEVRRTLSSTGSHSGLSGGISFSGTYPRRREDYQKIVYKLGLSHQVFGGGVVSHVKSFLSKVGRKKFVKNPLPTGRKIAEKLYNRYPPPWPLTKKVTWRKVTSKKKSSRNVIVQFGPTLGFTTDFAKISRKSSLTIGGITRVKGKIAPIGGSLEVTVGMNMFNPNGFDLHILFGMDFYLSGKRHKSDFFFVAAMGWHTNLYGISKTVKYYNLSVTQAMGHSLHGIYVELRGGWYLSEKFDMRPSTFGFSLKWKPGMYTYYSLENPNPLATLKLTYFSLNVFYTF